MCITEFDEELAKKTWHEDGRTEKAIETATNILLKNYPTSDISEITGLPIEQVLELQKSILVKA